MKIADSNLNLNSNHTHELTSISNEKLNVIAQIPILNDNITDFLELSDQAIKSQLEAEQVESKDFLSLSEKDKAKITLIESFVQSLTGKSFKLHIPMIKIAKPQNLKLPVKSNLLVPNFSISYYLQRTIHEKEVVSFKTEGIIKTQDNREINIDLNVNLKKESYFEERISLQMGNMKKIDPLVINFQGKLPELSEQKISFDLDLDGKEDIIPFLRSGSGFLALDKNNDGIINDGNELFGPQNGNGFSELALYDLDNNNWIDENDNIFNSLVVWTKDENGQDKLLALGDIGIGAIYLGNVDTPFALANTNQEEVGKIQKSGIFLFEKGSAGIIQHIDLSV